MAQRASTSFRTRLALLITGLAVGAIALLAVVAYREVRSTELAASSHRVENVAHQVGGMLETSVAQLRTRVHALATDSTVRAYLRAPSEMARQRAAARLQLRATQGATTPDIELWDASGAMLLVTGAPPPAAGAPAADSVIAIAIDADSAAVGQLFVAGNAVWFCVVARVQDGVRTLGFVVQRGTLTGSAQGAKQIRSLVGLDARMLIGNTRGDVWTDFSAIVPPLPIDAARQTGAVQYLLPGGDAQLAAIASIAGAPWSLVVELPAAQALVHAHAFLLRFATWSFALIALVMTAVWMLTGTLARPVAELARAAEDMSTGEYSRRVLLTRTDEFGTVGDAFNRMATNITSARDALNDKVGELARSESRYRLLFDANPQPMWVYDLETLAFLAVNDAAVHRYGYPREEFLRMTIMDIRPAEDASRLLTDLKEMDVHAPQLRVWRHRANDGSLFEAEVASQALTFDGRAARLVLANDVTERLRAETSLRSAQQRLQRAVASSGAVIFELRLTGEQVALEWISENVSAILGYSVEEAEAGRWWSDHVHPDDRRALGHRPRRDAYHDGATEYRFQHKNGQYRWLREEQRLLRNAANEPVGVIGAWLDITEQRSLEEQFRQSQKMEAIGRLAGGVAHDFNNLITVILGECETILTEPRMELATARLSVDEIRSAANRAAVLTRQLLTFSRREMIEPVSLEIDEVVSGVRTMLTRLIGEDVELRMRLNAEHTVTTADRGQLEQVFVNLVVNARDAMPNGGTISVETQPVELRAEYTDAHAGVEPGRYVMLAVGDTGIGMSDETKRHLFEPFYTTKEPGKGTGLGLATSYAIVKQFGGHIAVISELGQGTTVRVYLPRADDSARRTGERVSGAELAHGVETILVVEDEPQVRRVTVRTLTKLGYVVLEAADGDEALHILETRHADIHLLLSDVVLPKMGGRELAERVRTLYPSIRILFVSGYSNDLLLRDRVLGHQVLLVQKPFTSKSLSLKVREALEQA